MANKAKLKSSVFSRQEPVEIRNGIARFEGGAELVMREVQIRSGTAREITDETTGRKSRTFDCVWTTGAPVLRYDWWKEEYYQEELDVSESAIRMDRMGDGAPLLNSHWSYSLEDVLGRVERVWIENGVGYATVRMSNRSDVDDIWLDIQDGIIGKISVGYRVHKTETTREEGKITIKRAIDWEPYEISLVAIPADSGCSVREAEDVPATSTRMESSVPQATETTPETTGTETAARNEQTPVTPAAPSAPQGRSSTEAATIMRWAENAGLDLAATRALVEGTDSLEQIIRKHLDGVADKARETDVSTISTTATVTGQRSPAQEMQLRTEMFVAEALDQVGKRAKEPSEEARQFAGHGIRGMAIACLRNAGAPAAEHESTRTLVERALEMRGSGVIASSDLTHILGEPIRATLVAHYADAVEETDYQDWAGTTLVDDFKRHKAIYAGMFSGIRDVNERGQLPLARLGDGARYFEIGTRGLEIAFTRQAIVNDEYGALLEAVGQLGILYRHDEQNIAEETLNAGLMETQNGVEEVFGEDFGNYVEAAAFDSDVMTEVEKMLFSQRLGDEMGGTSTRGVSIRVKPAVAFCSIDQTTAVRKVFSDKIMPNNLDDVSPFAGMPMKIYPLVGLEEKTVIIGGTKGLANLIKIARLRGAAGPQIRRRLDGDLLEARWQSINDFGAHWVDRYGVVKVKID